MRSLGKSLKPHPDISVIVCHHKGDFIHRFVDSIKKSVGVTFEIIIITSDQAFALEGINGCKVSDGPQFPAEKRNIGFRMSTGTYLAFFDDDVEVDSDCLLKMKQFLDAHPTFGMVYGKLYNMEHRNRFDEAGGFLTSTGFIWSRAGQNDIDSGQYDVYETILAGKSASCMMRAETFHKVGGFDEQFGILGEETDLSWRVWLSGQKVCFVWDAIGYHAFNTKFKPAKDYYTSSRVHRNGCRNYFTMLTKNLGGETLWKILPIHIAIWGFAGVAMILSLKVRQGANIFLGLSDYFRNLPATLSKRRKIQEKRDITDRELFTYVFKNPSARYYVQRFCRYLRIGLHG